MNEKDAQKLLVERAKSATECIAELTLTAAMTREERRAALRAAIGKENTIKKSGDQGKDSNHE